MMTNRPWAKRSRWLTAIAVCAGAVGLAALLGAAMTAAGRRAGRAAPRFSRPRSRKTTSRAA